MCELVVLYRIYHNKIGYWLVLCMKKCRRAGGCFWPAGTAPVAINNDEGPVITRHNCERLYFNLSPIWFVLILVIFFFSFNPNNVATNPSSDASSYVREQHSRTLNQFSFPKYRYIAGIATHPHKFRSGIVAVLKLANNNTHSIQHFLFPKQSTDPMQISSRCRPTKCTQWMKQNSQRARTRARIKTAHLFAHSFAFRNICSFRF